MKRARCKPVSSKARGTSSRSVIAFGSCAGASITRGAEMTNARTSRLPSGTRTISPAARSSSPASYVRGRSKREERMTGNASTTRTEPLRRLAQTSQYRSHAARIALESVLDVADRSGQHKSQTTAALLLVGLHRREDLFGRERGLQRQLQEREEREDPKMLAFAKAPGAQRQETGGAQADRNRGPVR